MPVERGWLNCDFVVIIYFALGASIAIWTEGQYRSSGCSSH